MACFRKKRFTRNRLSGNAKNFIYYHFRILLSISAFHIKQSVKYIRKERNAKVYKHSIITLYAFHFKYIHLFLVIPNVLLRSTLYYYYYFTVYCAILKHLTVKKALSLARIVKNRIFGFPKISYPDSGNPDYPDIRISYIRIRPTL